MATMPAMKPSRSAAISSALQNSIRVRVLAWFQRHKRPMPWRNTSDPYAIWLSEVMLQQTQVATVEPYYRRFLQRFPDVGSLAAAPLEEVLKFWAGLGYYRRAKSLHKAACIITSTYHCMFPSIYDDILELPGIGRYTAGAIASIAFGQRVPVLDGNVMRVVTRLFAIDDDIARQSTKNRLWKIAENLVPRHQPGNFNQALMELGATICTPRNPRCETCPLEQTCAARRTNRQEMLPVKKRKAVPARMRLAAIILNSPRGQLLGRRKAGGLWEHLWEFPTFEISSPTAAIVSRHFFALTGLRLKLKRHPATVTHQLTHRRLEYVLFVGRTTSVAAVKFNAAVASNYDTVQWVAEIKSVPVARITGKLSALASADNRTDLARRAPA